MRARTFSIRFTEEEWRYLEDRAAKEQRSTGNLIRLLIFSGFTAKLTDTEVRKWSAQKARDELLNKMRTR